MRHGKEAQPARLLANVGLALMVGACAIAAPAQRIIKFNAPGAGTGIGQGTIAGAINSGDAIAGYYIDSSSVQHGFVRSASGTITHFDAPGAGSGVDQGTIARDISASGVIAGYSTDSGGVIHGFVRATSGTTTDFDVPGAGTGINQGTEGDWINTARE